MKKLIDFMIFIIIYLPGEKVELCFLMILILSRGWSISWAKRGIIDQSEGEALDSEWKSSLF